MRVAPRVDSSAAAPLVIFTDSLSALFRAQAVSPDAKVLLWGLSPREWTAARARDLGLNRYICFAAADGTLRWFAPDRVSAEVLLSLHNASSIRGLIFHAACRAFAAAGAIDLLASSVFLSKLSVRDFLASLPGGVPEGPLDAAFFSGTPGEDRKLTIAIAPEGKRVSHFAKLAATSGAHVLLAREATALARVRALGTAILAPSVVAWDPENAVLVLDSVAPDERPLPSDRFGSQHARALLELLAASHQTEELGVLGVADAALGRLDAPARDVSDLDRVADARLEAALRKMAEELPRDVEVAVGLAHGDFTPWNMFARADRLYVYDWELALEAPALHDLFHFVIQSRVLVSRWAANRILRELRDVMSLPLVRQLIQRYGVDPDLHLACYLLTQASTYLMRYRRQHPLHPQANWLIRTWRDLAERLVVNEERVFER